jgi:carboxylate-amine ligase
MPSAHSRLPFRGSTRFSLGVEEELHMAAPMSLQPYGGTDAVLARLNPAVGVIAGEVSDGVLELITPICENTGQAIEILSRLRVDAGQHVSLLGTGVHPLGRFGDVRLRAGDRYEQIGETMRGIMRQTPHCGVHVHVGMPDGETAVRACNGMRGWIPLLQTLGANSPFWYGRDSGLASTRSVICNSFPRAGIPRSFADYTDFALTVERLCALGECSDYSYLWWDVRPHPRLGTLEIRALDAQSSLTDLAGLVALVHCLAVHEATAPPAPSESPEVLRELSFRACRDGLEALLVLDGGLRPAREVAHFAIGLAGAYAADLGCWDELMGLHTLIEAGNGAMRQRRHEQEGGMRLLLRRLADETLDRKPVTAPNLRTAPRHPVPARGGRQLTVAAGTAGARA